MSFFSVSGLSDRQTPCYGEMCFSRWNGLEQCSVVINHRAGGSVMFWLWS